MSGLLGVVKPFDEPDADEWVYQYDLEPGGRLILNTEHGRIIIDSRGDDVNAFVFEGDKPAMAWVNPTNYACTNRKDITLLRANEP